MREIKKYEKALERLYRDNIIIDVYNIDNLISYCNLHNISFIIGKNIHLKKDGSEYIEIERDTNFCKNILELLLKLK